MITTNNKVFKQFLAVFLINLAAFLQGASFSCSSVMLGKLRSFNESYDEDLNLNVTTTRYSDIYITHDEATWIASGWLIGHLLSSFVSGIFSDLIGRRKALLVDIFTFLIGFGCLYFGGTVGVLVLGRIFLGFPIVSQVYITEILPAEDRGKYTAIYSLLHALGFAIQLLMGAYFDWRTSLLLPIAICIPSFIGVFSLHESPEWLLKRRQYKLSLESAQYYQLHHLQKRIYDEQMGEAISKQLSCKTISTISKQLSSVDCKSKLSRGFADQNLNKSSCIKLYLDKIRSLDTKLIRQLFLLSLLFIGNGWCGFGILGSYSTLIFERSGGPVQPEHASWITSLVKIPAALVAYFVIARFSRRGLFMILSIIICLSFLLVSLYLHVNRLPNICPVLMANLSATPMFMVIIAYAAFGSGFNVLPSLLAAESMPVHIRSTVIGYLVTLETLSMFLLIKFQADLLQILGIHGLFFLFAVVVFFVSIVGGLVFGGNLKPMEDIENKQNNITDKPCVVTRDQSTNTDLTLVYSIHEEDSSSDISQNGRKDCPTISDTLTHKLDLDEKSDNEVTDSHILQSLNRVEIFKVNTTAKDYDINKKDSIEATESSANSKTNNDKCKCNTSDTGCECIKFNDNVMNSNASPDNMVNCTEHPDDMVNCTTCPAYFSEIGRADMEITTYRL